VAAPNTGRIRSTLPRLFIRVVTREVSMIQKGSVILRRVWRSLYKPALDGLFILAKSQGVHLTPDVAMEEMEQAFKSVFLHVEDKSSFGPKKDVTFRPRLYLRFDRIDFRQETHHYAVDLFYNMYFWRKHELPRTAAKIVGGDGRRSALLPGTRVMSQPQMIREVLLKHGGPLHIDKIAKAIEKRFSVKLKKHDITSVIYRAIRGKGFFRKEGVNVFGLAS